MSGINKTSVCRTCLSVIDSKEDATSINDYAEKITFERIQIKEVIEKCISEMDLNISNDAVICKLCYGTLINTYLFKLNCFKTEERIYSYMNEKNLRLGDKINLSNLTGNNGTAEEVPAIISRHDCDYVQVVSSSESEKNCEINNAATCKTNEDSEKSVAEYLIQRDPLEKHVRKLKKYKCNRCQYESARKTHLSRHKLCHVDKRPYICGICGKNIKEKGNMRLHILYSHSWYMTMSYRCRVKKCDKVLEFKSDFNAHVVKHEKYKPFICQLCKKGFFSRVQWDRHMEGFHKLC